MPEKPLRLAPQFCEKIWGSTDLSPWFDARGLRVGEVWFEGTPPLSLLVKFLFTTDRLSVQVHPDDRQAADRGLPRGKTEMWRVLRADPGAAIALGFRRKLTKKELREAARSGAIEHLLEWMPVQDGESVFTPAGTVHALGAGLVICEIQQNSDTTYRLYDYGRDRPLHVAEALKVAATGPARHRPQSAPSLADGEARRIASCEHFVTDEVWAESEVLVPATTGAYRLLVVLEGQGQLGTEPYAAGECWLFAPGTREARLVPSAPSRFLRTGPPL